MDRCSIESDLLRVLVFVGSTGRVFGAAPRRRTRTGCGRGRLDRETGGRRTAHRLQDGRLVDHIRPPELGRLAGGDGRLDNGELDPVGVGLLAGNPQDGLGVVAPHMKPSTTRPAASAASKQRAASAGLVANGFSHSTCLPASRPNSDANRWALAGSRLATATNRVTFEPVGLDHQPGDVGGGQHSQRIGSMRLPPGQPRPRTRRPAPLDAVPPVLRLPWLAPLFIEQPLADFDGRQAAWDFQIIAARACLFHPTYRRGL